MAYQVIQHTKEADEAVYTKAGLDILSLLTQAKKGARGKSPNSDPTKKIGRFFTFFRFLDLIMKCAKATFTGYSTGSESQIYSNYL
jgi:hypothetical protein